MNIIFKKININNFLPIGNIEIVLEQQGFVLISAKNNYQPDNSLSNSSGKSAILDAIIWVMTGETSRGTKQVKNRNTQEGVAVYLDFEIDNKNYHIERYKEHSIYKTNLKIFVDGEDKSGKGVRDSELILKELLPDITSQLLSSVIILGQGLPQKFSNNSPSGRKEILEKLSKSDFMIEDIKERLKKRSLKLGTDLREKEDELLKLNNTIDIDNKRLTELQELQKNVVKKDFDKEINQIKELLNKQEKELKINQDELSTRKKELDTQLDKYNSITIAQREEENKVIDLYKPLLESHNKNLEDLKVKLVALNQKIENVKNIKDTCPTCGQKLPHIHKIDITEELTLKQELSKECNVLNALINDVQAQQEKEVQNIKDDYKLKLENAITVGKQIREKVNDLEQAINNYINIINNFRLDINKLELEKTNYETNVSNIKENIEKLEKHIKTNSDLIVYYNIEKTKVESRIEIINKITTLVNRDFRGYLLKNVIQFIDMRVKHYCTQIFDTNLLEFKLDGNDIYIGYDNNAYETLSGGQKQKVDLIIQFSIRDMLSELLNLKTNLLALDEIFDNLDSKGCDKVVQTITNNFTDISSVFIITHRNNELMIPYDKEIIIEKNKEGISCIRNE